MAATDASERLLNLIIALSNTRARLTRADIREVVAGYDREKPGEDAQAAARRTAAFERMFERDKDDLRKMGIPLRTVTDPTHGDDIGYVIDAGEAAMPVLEFSEVERAVLAVAAQYWQDTALDASAKRAWVKVASTAARAQPLEINVAARANARAAEAPALAQAIVDRQAIQFTYTSASVGRAKRTVEPWRLVVRGSALYLVAFDRDRGEPRTFRVNRIEGAVKAIGEAGAFEAPENVSTEALSERVPTLRAKVGLLPEVGHSMRQRGVFVETVDNWDVYEVPYIDTDALRAEVLTLSGGAKVIEPAEVAEAVVDYAQRIRAVTHG